MSSYDLERRSGDDATFDRAESGTPGARTRTASLAGAGAVQRSPALPSAAREPTREEDPFSVHLDGVVQRREAADGGAPATAAAADRGGDELGIRTAYSKIVPGIDHVFLEFDDGYSVGFSRRDEDPPGECRIYSPDPSVDRVHTRHPCRRKRDDVSKNKPAAEIKQQIRTYAETVSPGRYNVITNNCGDWVRRAQDQAWLVPETPWHIY
jgi:hypothetical protein